MNTIAAIEATPTVRLSELWLERWSGPVSFRFGQLAADAEFFYSDRQSDFHAERLADDRRGQFAGRRAGVSVVGCRGADKVRIAERRISSAWRFSTAIQRALLWRSRHLQSLWSQFPYERSGIHDWRTAISTQPRQARHRPRNDAEDRRLECISDNLPTSSSTNIGMPLANPGQQWHAADASRRLRNLWSHRSAALSPRAATATAAFPFSTGPRSVRPIAIWSTVEIDGGIVFAGMIPNVRTTLWRERHLFAAFPTAFAASIRTRSISVPCSLRRAITRSISNSLMLRRS